jgi:hypothetical protein
MRIVSRALVVLIGVAGCDLAVTNVNDPDRDRLLRTPADVEELIGQLYRSFNNATIGGTTATGAASNDQLQPQLLTSGMESYSGNANFQMGPRGAIPRANPHVDNGRGNAGETGNLRDYLRLSVTARSAADGLRRLGTPGFTIGSAARDAQAKAFAQFALGLALGHLGMTYDSSAIISPADDPELIDRGIVPPLQGYRDVMSVALGWLDSAQATVTANASIFGSLPNTWINGNAPNADGFTRIIRSYRARMRAAQARTRAERETAVNWNAVIDDATNGITADLNVAMNPARGWDVSFVAQHYLFQSWHQMWQFMIGFADVSGEFDAWLNTPVTSRRPFLVVTPDKRFPQGATRPTQQAASGCDATRCAPPTGNLYFRNRPSSADIAGISLAFSFYDFYRFQAFFDAQRIGNYPVMTQAEMNLLAAEGYIRTNQVALAAPLIDASRVAKGGLPSLVMAGITDLTTPVPGGSGCVPRVPQPPTFTSTACGNILEALKWEKRMETAFIGYGSWYFDSRGWGDLPQRTALHWPVPWQEMDARSDAGSTTPHFYNMPDVAKGTLPGAGPGTYGL